MSRRCKRLSNCSPDFDSQIWLAEVIATSHAILCVWSKAGRSGDPLWGWFSLAQAASWHSLAFRSFSTRYTLALPIPSLVAISEGLAPSSLSRMISAACPPNGRRTPLVAALTLGFSDLALQHGFSLGLSHGADDRQHQPAHRRARVEGLRTRHGQHPERDLLGVKPGDNLQ